MTALTTCGMPQGRGPDGVYVTVSVSIHFLTQFGMYLQLCGSILGNKSFFHIMISDGDKLVLRSHFSLEKWHSVTSSFTLLPCFCFFSFVVVWGRAVTRNSNPWILKKEKSVY